MKLLRVLTLSVIAPQICVHAAPAVTPRIDPVPAAALKSVPKSLQEEMRWQGWAPAGQIVEINNVYGNVRAEEASGDEIEVIATKRGASDPQRVSIEVAEHKGGVTVCAVYPNADPHHPFECRPSRGGGFRVASMSDSEARIRWDNGGGGDVLLNDLRVDFLVRVPKGMRFIGRTVDGEISTQLFDQDVEAHSVRGDVNFEMNLAKGAELRAETRRGELDSEFPIAVHAVPHGGLYASGRFGHSRRTVRLKTGSGNIRLQRMRS